MPWVTHKDGRDAWRGDGVSAHFGARGPDGPLYYANLGTFPNEEPLPGTYPTLRVAMAAADRKWPIKDQPQ